MKLLAPSVLSADFSNLAQQIRLVEMGGADWLHCDIMDGRFVPNITFGPLIVEALKRITKLPLDVHLMIEKPDNYFEDFVKAGADFITIHQESVVHLNRAVNKIKELGIKAGVALNPATPISTLVNILEDVDMILIMSVNPGYGGQSFIKNSLEKIKEVAKMRDSRGLDFLIEVDGGINLKTIHSVSAAGCDVFVAGSAVFSNDNMTGAAVELKNIITEVNV